jgi:hypothetical protein
MQGSVPGWRTFSVRAPKLFIAHVFKLWKQEAVQSVKLARTILRKVTPNTKCPWVFFGDVDYNLFVGVGSGDQVSKACAESVGEAPQD